MKIKRCFIGLLIFALMISLCACKSTKNDDKSQDSAPINSFSDKSQSNAVDSDSGTESNNNDTTTSNIDSSSANELISIFDDIKNNYHLGVAGQSINAMEKEIKLLDWASVTNMSEANIEAETTKYINKLDDDTKSEFVQKLTVIDYYRNELLSEEEELSIDVQSISSQYPWNRDAVNNNINAIIKAARA